MWARRGSVALILAVVVFLIGAGPCQKRGGRRADVDRNGYVEEADRALVEGCVADPLFDPRCFRADTDLDGDLDTHDVAFVESRLGRIRFDPNAPYVAHHVCVDSAGVVYLLDLIQDRIFRWSLSEARPLAPLDLDPDPLVMAYAPGHDRVYVGHLDGSLVAIDPLFPDIRHSFASLSQYPRALLGAGEYLFAMDSSPTGSVRNHSTFAVDGTLLSHVSGVYISPHLAFSAVHGRVYFNRQGYSPDDILWEPIDPLTGAIGPLGSAGSDFKIAGPLRPTADGSRFTLGSGDVYESADFVYDGSLPIDPTDLLWLPDGGLLTIRPDPTGGTLVEEWTPSLLPRNVRWLSGEPVRLVEGAGRIAVITVTGSRTTLHLHVPGEDGDGDGVPFDADGFPLDPAASVDTDHDGYPDTWNPGFGPSDSTQGLVIDAFPYDAACQLAEHAPEDQPGVCVIEERIPEYTPVYVAVDAQGIVHLYSSTQSQIFRWSLATEEHLNPIPVGDASRMVDTNGRGAIHLGYWATGAITRFEPTEPFPRETYVAATPGLLHSLAEAGDLLFAGSTLSFTLSPDGSLLNSRRGLAGGSAFDWDAAGHRLFYATTHSPKDIERIEIDPVSGGFGARAESPYHGQFPISRPVRLSPDGRLLLLGSGYFYDTSTLEIVAALPVAPSDALWLADAGLLTIRPDGLGGTVLEQWAPDRQLAGVASFPGEPLFVVTGIGRFAAVTLAEGRPAFFPFERMDDADADGVPVGLDAFPLDPAASLDRDGDGAPDAWNPGAGPGDSTEGLSIDVFPDDFACQLPEHGMGGVCDYYRVLPHDPSEPLCDADTPPPAGTEGELRLGSIADVIPLCDGWLVLAEDGIPEGRRIAVRNVVDGREGERFLLPGQPGALALDETRRKIYAALPKENAVAAVDLQTGFVFTYPLDDVPMDLALDPLGNLFAVVKKRDLHYLSVGGDAFEGGWYVEGSDFLAWNAARNELLVGQDDSSSTNILRYSFHPGTGPVLLERSSRTASGYGIALSPDGAHIAMAQRQDSGADRNLWHLDAGDLWPPIGEWVMGAQPWAVAFDPSSTRLAASNGSAALVFDVATYALLDTLPAPPPACTLGVRGVLFSRGERLLVGRERCGSQSRLFWRVRP